MTRAEYEAKYGQAPVLPAASTTAPLTMTHAEYMAKYGSTEPKQTIGSAGQTVIPGSTIKENLKQLPAQLLDAGKALFKTITSSEQAVGGEIAAGLPASVTGEQALNEANQSNAASDIAFIKAINEKRKAGQPITKSQQEIYDYIVSHHSSVGTQEDLLPHAKDTNLDAALNIGGTALDLIGSGTIGKGAKGAETGKLFKATPTAVTAAKAIKNTPGNVLEKTGQKIQQSVIRPSARDIADGFKIENVQKYDVGGSLPETIAKTHTRMNDLSAQLTQKLQGSNVAVNLNHAVKQTLENLTAGKARSFGDNTAIERVIGSLKKEVHAVAGKNGLVDLLEATNVKRGAGAKGAWSYNRPEADASAIEKVYTEFYSVLKKQIENAAPEGVKEINKQLSDLIPIQTAALRRLPVEQRNNALGLTDSIGLFSSIFDPKALLVLGATKAARSGRVGNALVKTGSKLLGK